MRVKRGNVNVKRHKKILKLAKGYRGAKSKLFRTTHQHGKIKRSWKSFSMIIMN